jgi:hypothetical protein
MDAFSELLGDRRGYEPRPGDVVFHACAWPFDCGLPPRRRGPYRDYCEARDAALIVNRGYESDGWQVLVEEARVDRTGDFVVIDSTPASQLRP